MAVVRKLRHPLRVQDGPDEVHNVGDELVGLPLVGVGGHHGVVGEPENEEHVKGRTRTSDEESSRRFGKKARK